MSRITHFCNALIEACWLAALIVAPIYFDTYSARIFEPDKIAFVRGLALLIAAAWFATVIDGAYGRGGINWRAVWLAVWRTPLAGAVMALVAVTILSSIFSLTPRFSVWGSYARQQGLHTLLAYVVIFAAILGRARSRAQIDRIVSVILLASLPVGVYGILQRLELDPLPWREDTSERVSSTLGNAIFLAAYLIMMVPLTAARLLESLNLLIGGQAAGGPATPSRAITGARLALYAVTLAAQLSAIYFSGSRGPWLGLLAGLFVWALMLTNLYGKRRLALGVVTAAGLAAALLVTLNIPNGPLESLRSLPYIGRLGHVFDGGDATGRVRVLIWQGAARMALPHAPLRYPDGTPDALNPIRPIVGYGPESIHVAFHHFYDPEIAHYERRTAMPDRSHNETFDALITTGVLGLAALSALFGAIFFHGLRWLGLLGPADKWLYVTCLGVGGVAGVVGLVAWRGPEYFGVGLPIGALIGMLGLVSYCVLRRGSPPADGWRAAMLAALLAALVAHFTELSFGIAIASTRLYFFAFTAMLISLGRAAPSRTPDGAPTRDPAEFGLEPAAAPAVGWAQWLPGALSALILIPLTASFIVNTRGAEDLFDIIRNSFLSVFTRPEATSAGVLVMFGLVWLGASVALADTWSTMRLNLLISLSAWAAFTLYHAAIFVVLANQQRAELPISEVSGSYVNVLVGFGAWFLGAVLFAAIALYQRGPESTSVQPNIAVAAAGLLAAAAAVAYIVNLHPVQADMYYKIGQSLSASRSHSEAVSLYRRAIGLTPFEDEYYISLGQAQIAQAQSAGDSGQRLERLRVAIRTLAAARSLNPMLPEHSANLGQVYRLAAQNTSDPEQEREYLITADQYYAQALLLAPNSVDLWHTWARFHLTMLRNYDQAFEKLQTALAVDEAYAPAHASLGDYWVVLGNNEAERTIKLAYYQRAAESYRTAVSLELAQPEKRPTLKTLLALGDAEMALSNWDAAIEAYLQLLEYGSEASDVWLAYKSAARAYAAKGEPALALGYARQALAAAPASQQAEIQALIDTLSQ